MRPTAPATAPPATPSPLSVAFVLNDLALSGGVGVVVTHARNLAAREDFSVTLVLAREHDTPAWAYEQLPELEVVPLAAGLAETYDVAVSTWWETAFALFHLRARRYASFVQSMEDRFYQPWQEAERLGARLTYDLPVSFITEARWLAETLQDIRPDAPVHLVRNGIDKRTFSPVAEVPERGDGPLRVLVEGNPEAWIKGTGEAIGAVRGMREPYRLTIVAPTRAGLAAEDASVTVGPISQRELADVYADTDVLVKLSHVEGMYGPPLEAFHKGATCVTTEVTGSDEYIRHGFNALVVDWDDERGTSRQLDLLARDHDLLQALRTGAIATAHAWPSWETSSEWMGDALRAIATSPPPDPYSHVARLTTDLRAGLERERRLVHEHRLFVADVRRWQRVMRLPLVSQALAARRRLMAGVSRLRAMIAGR